MDLQAIKLRKSLGKLLRLHQKQEPNNQKAVRCSSYGVQRTISTVQCPPYGVHRTMSTHRGACETRLCATAGGRTSRGCVGEPAFIRQYQNHFRASVQPQGTSSVKTSQNPPAEAAGGWSFPWSAAILASVSLVKGQAKHIKVRHLLATSPVVCQ